MTGVQTCALPISTSKKRSVDSAQPANGCRYVQICHEENGYTPRLHSPEGSTLAKDTDRDADRYIYRVRNRFQSGYCTDPPGSPRYVRCIFKPATGGSGQTSGHLQRRNYAYSL